MPDIEIPESKVLAVKSWVEGHGGKELEDGGDAISFKLDDQPFIIRKETSKVVLELGPIRHGWKKYFILCTPDQADSLKEAGIIDDTAF